MDWGKVKSPAPPAVDPRAATLIEICWHIRTPHGRAITCGIYRDAAPCLDVRAQFSDDDLLRSQRSAEIGAARDVADEWKRAILAKGTFIELKGGA